MDTKRTIEVQGGQCGEARDGGGQGTDVKVVVRVQGLQKGQAHKQGRNGTGELAAVQNQGPETDKARMGKSWLMMKAFTLQQSTAAPEHRLELTTRQAGR
jgi:hypothetical protein